MMRLYSSIILLSLVIFCGTQVQCTEKIIYAKTGIQSNNKIPPLPDLRRLGQFLPGKPEVGSWSEYKLTTSSKKNDSIEMFFIAVDSCSSLNGQPICWFDVVLVKDSGKTKNWIRYKLSILNKEIIEINYLDKACSQQNIDTSKMGKTPLINVIGVSKEYQKTTPIINIPSGTFPVKWFIMKINKTTTFVALSDQIKPLRIVKAIAPYYEIGLVRHGQDWSTVATTLRSKLDCWKKQ